MMSPLIWPLPSDVAGFSMPLKIKRNHRSWLVSFLTLPSVSEEGGRTKVKLTVPLVLFDSERLSFQQMTRKLLGSTEFFKKSKRKLVPKNWLEKKS